MREYSREEVDAARRTGYWELKRFSKKVTRRYDWDGFRSAANLGVAKALDTWSPEKGSLSTWTTHCVRGELLHEHRSQTPCTNFAYYRMGRGEPRPDDKVYWSMSLNATCAVTEEPFIDLIADPATVRDVAQDEADAFQVRVCERLAVLDERLQKILRRRFFDNLSQLAVSREMGMSQMHVSRLERQALARLRELLK